MSHLTNSGFCFQTLFPSEEYFNALPPPASSSQKVRLSCPQPEKPQLCFLLSVHLQNPSSVLRKWAQSKCPGGPLRGQHQRRRKQFCFYPGSGQHVPKELALFATLGTSCFDLQWQRPVPLGLSWCKKSNKQESGEGDSCQTIEQMYVAVGCLHMPDVHVYMVHTHAQSQLQTRARVHTHTANTLSHAQPQHRSMLTAAQPQHTYTLTEHVHSHMYHDSMCVYSQQTHPAMHTHSTHAHSQNMHTHTYTTIARVYTHSKHTQLCTHTQLSPSSEEPCTHTQLGLSTEGSLWASHPALRRSLKHSPCQRLCHQSVFLSFPQVRPALGRDPADSQPLWGLWEA